MQKKQLIYKTRPGYDSQNRCSFNRFLKVSRDGAQVTSAGRSFHMRALATGKARCPIVGSLTTGTHSSLEVEDRNLCRDQMSAIDVNCLSTTGHRHVEPDRWYRSTDHYSRWLGESLAEKVAFKNIIRTRGLMELGAMAWKGRKPITVYIKVHKLYELAHHYTSAAEQCCYITSMLENISDCCRVRWSQRLSNQ